MFKIGEIVHYGHSGPYGQPCIPAIVVATGGGALQVVLPWRPPHLGEMPGGTFPTVAGKGTGQVHPIGDCPL